MPRPLSWYMIAGAGVGADPGPGPRPTSVLTCLTAAPQAAAALTAEVLEREVARRRNFAIISHPDAGKTTMVCT